MRLGWLINIQLMFQFVKVSDLILLRFFFLLSCSMFNVHLSNDSVLAYAMSNT